MSIFFPPGDLAVFWGTRNNWIRWGGMVFHWMNHEKEHAKNQRTWSCWGEKVHLGIFRILQMNSTWYKVIESLHFQSTFRLGIQWYLGGQAPFGDVFLFQWALPIRRWEDGHGGVLSKVLSFSLWKCGWSFFLGQKKVLMKWTKSSPYLPVEDFRVLTQSKLLVDPRFHMIFFLLVYFVFLYFLNHLPSGKRLHNNGKIHHAIHG